MCLGVFRHSLTLQYDRKQHNQNSKLGNALKTQMPAEHALGILDFYGIHIFHVIILEDGETD